MRNISRFLVLLLLFCLQTHLKAQKIMTGSERTDAYIGLLENKRVGMVVNHTSVITSEDGSLVPLPDSLLNRGIDIRCIMAPEHGYKGVAGAGEHLANGKDENTGLKIYSLYGNTRKPQKEWLEDIDIIVFDLQDVGARFYTYLSTLKNVLEAAYEQDKEVMVMDRPNPNDIIDGPILEKNFESFVGVIPIPVLHGCTLGELALMMKGQGWVNKDIKVTVIPCSGWKHGDTYVCPVAPSPNLPNAHAIQLYPSLCLFEGTSVSVGRGTSFPFEVYGHPAMKSKFSFVPRASASNKTPLQKDKTCYGEDLRKNDCVKGFSLQFIIKSFNQLGASYITSASFFDRLAGSDKLRRQILSGMKEEEIRKTWQKGLDEYKIIRTEYLMY